MSIQKRGAGYTVRWRDSAGVQHSQQVRLWRDALTLDGEMKRKRAMGELIAHEKGKITLDEFWRIWWQQHALVHLTERSRAGYQQQWRKRIQPTFGKQQLRQIERTQVADFVASLVREGLAGSTIHKNLMVLQGLLARAMEWEYVNANVAVGVKKPPVQSKRGRIISAEELEALCVELDPRSETITRVLAGSGLRPGELRALRWRDLAEHTIIVEAAVSNDQFGPTKNRCKRSVEIRPEVRRALVEWRLRQGSLAPDDLVFPSADGRGVWTDNGYRLWSMRYFRPATVRAGLKGLRVYDLRHTFVSRLIADGRDIYWIARQAGHSPEIALTTYAHLMEPVREACATDWLAAASSSPLGDSNP